MNVWALGEFDNLPHDGEYTPVATYTKPAWTGSLTSGVQLITTTIPAKTVEVVAPVQTINQGSRDNEVTVVNTSSLPMSTPSASPSP